MLQITRNLSLIKSLTFTGILLLSAFVGSTRASTIVLQEPFATDTSGTAQTLATYPEFSLIGGSTQQASVTGGVLQLSPLFAPSFTQGLVTQGSPGDLTISLDLGTTGGDRINAGLRIGSNNLVFHPGDAADGGAFRVEGPGGFSNQNMGFTPSFGSILDYMTVTVFEATGLFQIQVVDGGNPSQVYNTSFVNPGYQAGDLIGLETAGTNDGIQRFAFFDNLKIVSSVSSVPEPATIWFFVTAFTILFVFQPGKKTRQKAI